MLVVADGDFSVAELRAQLPEPEGVVLMSRCAKNRSLHELPEPPEEGYRPKGRRRKYGDKARKPSEWLRQKKGWSQKPFLVRGRMIRARHRVEGPFVLKGAPQRPVFLVVVSGRKATKKDKPGQKERKPAFWLVSAVRKKEGEEEGWVLPYPAEELLFWAWQRWEVEVCHREMKTGFGVGEAQCWAARSAIFAVRFRVFSYSVMVLAGYRVWGLGVGTMRPAGRWWGGSRRWSMGSLWRGYRAEMWGTGEFRAIFVPTRGGWPEKEGLLAGMNNAASGSLRG